MSTDDKIARARAEFLVACGTTFDRDLAWSCDSPIEKLFLAGMIRDGFTRQVEGDAPGLGFKSCRAIYRHQGLMAATQAELSGAPYRLDFAFWGVGRPGFAVELDGHDFHERTKEQARRDKRRDRDLVVLGWRVLRFTGSEVYKDPRRCLIDVLQAIGAVYRGTT